ncbi:hypothetical protein [Nissabacter sp. SGAir0207]|nr:hypothetical protein [Nissabacter sp. SGAir0207]
MKSPISFLMGLSYAVKTAGAEAATLTLLFPRMGRLFLFLLNKYLMNG